MEITKTHINFPYCKNKMVRIASGYFCFILCQLLIIAFSSCKKSETEELFSNYKIVKIFDDSLASTQTTFESIVAGNDRLFITYGHGSYFSTRSIQVIVTDNDGNLIHQDSLPAGFGVGSTFALNDGTFMLLATHDINSTIHLFNYNKNGAFISHDSLSLPIISPYPIYFKTITIHNDHFIIYGQYTGQSNTEYFIAECDRRANVIWFRHTNLWVSAAVATPDGGYLMVQDRFLYKSNATGDSLWSKPISVYEMECRQMKRTANGNYRLCVNRGYGTGWWNLPQTAESLYVYEMNENGDSLGMSEINEMFLNWQDAMVSNEQNTFVLVSSIYDRNFIVGVNNGSVRMNTHFVIIDSGMKITEHGALQNQSTDLINSACKTSDGRIACFGLIQSYNQGYFKPGLIILK